MTPTLPCGNKDEAKRQLELAAANCPYHYSERRGAVAELKALNAGP